MKRLFLLLIVAGLSACASSRYGGHHDTAKGAAASGNSSRYSGWNDSDQVAAAPVKRKAVLEAEEAARRSMVDGVPVQKVAFRPGVSSATVERLAFAQECRGGQGAGLVTEPGPVEIYRMACSNGKVFMARCELRQCAAMNQDTASR